MAAKAAAETVADKTAVVAAKAAGAETEAVAAARHSNFLAAAVVDEPSVGLNIVI